METRISHNIIYHEPENLTNHLLNDYVHTDLKRKSNFSPTLKNNTHLELFKEYILEDLERLPTTSHFKNYNLNFNEMKALKALKNNSSLVIRQADKGGGIVLQDLSDYLHTDPTEKYLKILTGNICIRLAVNNVIIWLSLMLKHVPLFSILQISHFSTSPLLSDRRRFPSFFRTVPSDAFQSLGLARLVLHFGWTWVGLLAVDNDYGQQGIQLVRQEIIKAGACVAFAENILMSQSNRNAPYIVKIIKESNVKTIVVFSTAIDLLPILQEMLIQNVTGRTLIASEAWSTSTLFSMKKYSVLLSGTVGLALHSGSIKGFQKFLNKLHPSTSLGGHWAKLFWEQTFNCQFLVQENVTGSFEIQVKQCTGEESLETIQNSYTDISSLRETYNVYTAVNVVAKAMDSLKNCKNGNSPFSKGKCANIWDFKPWQLLHYVQRVKIMLSDGRELSFDENGDPPAVYDIVNWQLTPGGIIKHVKVGKYDTASPLGQDFIINTSAMLWATGNQQVPVSICSPSCPIGYRKAAIRGEPVCCFDCVPCPHGEISNQTAAVDCFKCPLDKWPNFQKSECIPKIIEYLSYEEPLGAALAATSIISSLVPIIILKYFIQYKSSPVVKASNYSLSCLLLVFLSLCFLCSLAFIGYPQKQKCLLRQVAFGMTFTLCISCLLAKTIMVVLAFMASKPGTSLRKLTKPKVSYNVIFFCSFIQFIVCILWVSFSPPFPDHKIQTQSGIIFLECNEGSPSAFWSMLGYLGFLATLSFIVAFFARRLPDSFNEARYITFSMLAFLTVWVSYIPASLSARGKYTVAMEVFAIQSSSWALLICIFVPKSFILLLRPNMNSREYIMRKNRIGKD
ncbi:extracellular calcium-sensing receptor-like [Bombina bombina]|uniref:extracellular calcium-sensing receptor-like n=1 Tax=Bombina bombina TaxID=8345 RepID=UPI00235AD0BE|nr:extracellular calcium-sensing receptor-like [Bombina bombina]